MPILAYSFDAPFVGADRACRNAGGATATEWDSGLSVTLQSWVAYLAIPGATSVTVEFA